MDTDLKEKWVEALRSGKYEQGTAALRTTGAGGEHRYCCLGVLCDILGKGHWEEFTSGVDRFVYEGDEGEDVLPTMLAEELGLDEEPDVRIRVTNGRDDWVPVTVLNDGLQGFEKWSFDEIATAIENNL